MGLNRRILDPGLQNIYGIGGAGGTAISKWVTTDGSNFGSNVLLFSDNGDNNNLDSCRITNNTYAVVYEQQTTNDVELQAFNDAHSGGTQQTVVSAPTNPKVRMCNVSDNKVLICVEHSNNMDLYTYTTTGAGTALTLDASSVADFTTNGSTFISVAPLSPTRAIVQYTGASNRPHARGITIGSGTVTGDVGELQLKASSNENNAYATAKITSTTALCGYTNSAASGNNIVQVVTDNGSSLSGNTEKIIATDGNGEIHLAVNDLGTLGLCTQGSTVQNTVTFVDINGTTITQNTGNMMESIGNSSIIIGRVEFIERLGSFNSFATLLPNIYKTTTTINALATITSDNKNYMMQATNNVNLFSSITLSSLVRRVGIFPLTTKKLISLGVQSTNVYGVTLQL